jgi:type IV secretion system protein VirD4
MAQDHSSYARYVGEHAFDNHYLSTEEMKAKLQRFSLSHPETNTVQGGIPLIKEGDEVYLDSKDYHTLILGATGSMKTRLFVLPEIFTLGLANENMVISDPKGEIFLRSSGWLKEQGYQIQCLNLRSPAESDCWNPLYEAFQLYETGELAKQDSARSMINDFVSFMTSKIHSEKDPFWEVQAGRFTQAAILTMFAFEKDVTKIALRSVSSFLTAMNKREDALGNAGNDILEMANNLSYESLIRDSFLAVAGAPDSTRQCLIGMAISMLSPFVLSDSISYITSHNTLDLHAFSDPAKKTALFIIVPDEKTTYHFLAAGLIKQLYEVAVGDASSLPGLKLPRRLNFILDEFANMPKIPDMGSMVSAARSRNIRFTLVVQNNAQLQHNYGADLAETIKSNCLNWIYLNSKEIPLQDQLVHMGGVINRSEGKPLVSMEELNALAKNWGSAEALIFLNRCPPYMTAMPDIDSYGFASYPPVEIPSSMGRFRSFNIVSDVFEVYTAQEITDRLGQAEGLAPFTVSEDGDRPIGNHHLRKEKTKEEDPKEEAPFHKGASGRK